MHERQHANRLSRALSRIRRLDGILAQSADRSTQGTWLLSQPSFPRQLLPELVSALLEPSLPPLHVLARLVGAAPPVKVDRGLVAAAARDLRRIGGGHRVAALARQGHGALRRYRNVDIAALVGRAHARRRALSGHLSGRFALRVLTDAPALDSDFHPALTASARRTLGRLAAWLDESQLARVAVIWQPRPTRADKRWQAQVRAATRFAASARRKARCLPARDDAESRLYRAFDDLPVGRRRRAEALVELFCKTVGDETPRSERLPWSAGIDDMVVTDLEAATHRLVDLWRSHRSSRAEKSRLDRRLERHLLTLALAHPDLGLPLDLIDDHRVAARLIELCLAAKSEVVSRAFASLACLPLSELRKLDRQLLQRHPKPELVERAFVLHAHWALSELPQRRDLVRYLDLMERLHNQPIVGLPASSHWLVSLFASGRSWVTDLVLQVVRRQRAEPRRAVATLVGISQGLMDKSSRALLDPLSEWGTTHIEEEPAQFDMLLEQLQIPRDSLRRYLHLRRLTGHGETFSRALLGPFHKRAATQAQIDWLNHQLQHGHLSAERRQALGAKRDRLADVEQEQARFAGDVARALRCFERGLVVLEQQALALALNNVAKSALERQLGRPLGRQPLPEGFENVIALLGASNLDRNLLSELLGDIVSGSALHARAPNRRWLASMATRGLNQAQWLAGFRHTVVVDDQAIEWSTEHSPLDALAMGTYFNTCLSLDDGFNAASTLINALDVNKQVLYGRRTDGAVVARKLIGVTDDAALVGYHTYAFQHRDEQRRQIAGALAEYAAACGLELADEGTPAVLHDGFWYDDGNEPWRCHPPAAKVGSNSEELFVAGFEDPRHWRDERLHGDWHTAAAVQLRLCDPGFVGQPELGLEGRREMIQRGQTRWMGDDSYRDLAAVIEALPYDPGVAAAVCRRVRRLRGGCGSSRTTLPTWSPGWAMARVRQIAHVVEVVCRLAREVELECVVDSHADCQRSFAVSAADVLEVAYCAAPDPDTVCGLLDHKDPLVRRVAAELASRCRVAGSGRRLRRGMTDGLAPHLVNALGCQGGKADAWWLTTRLRLDPSDRHVAAALRRCDGQATRQLASHLAMLRWPGRVSVPQLRDIGPRRLQLGDGAPRQWRELAEAGLDPDVVGLERLARGARLPLDEVEAIWSMARGRATAETDDELIAAIASSPDLFGLSWRERCALFRVALGSGSRRVRALKLLLHHHPWAIGITSAAWLRSRGDLSGFPVPSQLANSPAQGLALLIAADELPSSARRQLYQGLKIRNRQEFVDGFVRQPHRAAEYVRTTTRDSRRLINLARRVYEPSIASWVADSAAS